MKSHSKKVLLTSVPRPLGEKYGDAPSVGYELLHCQVTRAQGLFSPRSLHVHFSLEYVAENLDAPTTVLQYPSKRELIRELEKGYDIVGVSFLLATFHRMKEVVALVRRHAPKAEIVLGGYGTVLDDDALRPLGDHVCREEGVGFMRRLLGEPDVPIPHRHPLIVNPLRVFGREVSRTGIVIGGLGCPNGCDFCCTSQFFKRKHIRLLPTGADIHRVIARYLEIDPRMNILVIDEDFLLNRKRAMEFRDIVQKDGRPLSVFVFASIRAISQYTVTEILEMGIDGMWIGYEGTRSGFPKQQGRPAAEIFREFREHGIGILASMIVGFPYQTPEIIEGELSGLIDIHPDLTQFLIYGPVPGTPFHERVMKEGLLHDDLVENPETFYRKGSGFYALVKHPTMSPAEIEMQQRRCFAEDFRRLGPSIYRALETWLLGYRTLRRSPSEYLRAKAQLFGEDLRKAYPVFLAGKLFGPTREVRRWIADLERRVHEALGPPTPIERLQSVAAIGLAAWTSARLRLGWFEHPPLVRHEYRMEDDDPLAPLRAVPQIA
ncbi:MAG: cobalamin B12-binding domain-containing protein [Planctomycetes bacterium]|nr:cobalamin B12-binding domain-containing protein [Planctomycetota bacterium]